MGDAEARDRLRGCCGAEVVLYDEGTAEAEQVTADHPLAPVVASVRELGASPVLLRGELAFYILSLIYVLYISQVHGSITHFLKNILGVKKVYL